MLSAHPKKTGELKSELFLGIIFYGRKFLKQFRQSFRYKPLVRIGVHFYQIRRPFSSIGSLSLAKDFLLIIVLNYLIKIKNPYFIISTPDEKINWKI